MDKYEKEFYKTEIERLKLELEKSNSDKSLPPKLQKEIQEIVELATEMRTLLSQCRYEQINMNLAKKIDYVLKRATYMD
jgi:hypothetical protein